MLLAQWNGAQKGYIWKVIGFSSLCYVLWVAEHEPESVFYSSLTIKIIRINIPKMYMLIICGHVVSQECWNIGEISGKRIISKKYKW